MRLKIHHVLLMFCSAWMMGIGFGFLLMKPTDIYVFTLLDKVFDWGILFILGILVLIYAVYDYSK